MPKITDLKIQKSNKARANLYLDGEFAFGVEMLTVMKLGLKIGQEVTEEKLREAIFDSEKSVAFEKAMDYLGRGMKTSRQMRDYLSKKGYTQQVTEYVVKKLQEYKYLDDVAYAKIYVEQNSKTKGSRRLLQELQNKGISREKAEEFSQLDSDVAFDAARALAVKYLKNKPDDVKTAQKLQRYLLGRGYGYETVNSVLRSCRSGDLYEGENDD